MPAQCGYYDTLKSLAGKMFTYLASITITGVDGKALTVENDSTVNQDLTTDASPIFAGATLNGQVNQETYVIRKFITKAGIADNSATSVFRITTVDEASADGGAYSVKVHALVGQAISSASAAMAAKSFTAQFVHVVDSTGNAANSAVSEDVETASAADAPASRDIGTVTMTVVAISAYLTDIQFLVDVTGTVATTAQVFIMVELIWAGFLTPPTITAI